MASLKHGVTLWTYRRIPYKFESGFPFEGDVLDAIAKWEYATGVRFVPWNNERNYILIQTPRPNEPSTSDVGMKGGQQGVFIGQGFLATHELGHTLGLIHEQTRQDRDTFVTIEWSQIIRERVHDFVLQSASVDLTPYDLQSVMHYPAPAKGWGGPRGQEVWTMHWNKDHDGDPPKRLGAGAYQGWSNPSDFDTAGVRRAYEDVPVPMGEVTESGTWQNPYAVQFPFAIDGRVFYFGQNQTQKNWFIQELLPGGTLGAQTDSGTWENAYGVQFPFTIDGRVFYFGQNQTQKSWFIQELLPGGTLGALTDSGTWENAYGVQFPFMIDGRVFYYGQNLTERNWFIQELLPDGTMGAQTDSGAWKFAYRVQFPFTIYGRVFFYGQNLTERNWFIQELLPDGTMGEQTDHGTWKFSYGAQFPYNINGDQYFFGQNLETNYWFIQRILPGGIMGQELQSGRWKAPYATQFPFAIQDEQYFLGQRIPSEYTWFIRRLIATP
ncbi:MAG TPA: M12 family metallopeptidase [Solirubrobacteraceae bacterium]|jgi:hypothetical protein|nr:M12 family metallopeptidase [Solirubrobacteraceae bacterium]